jgi:intein-encoded DNA endonuclease-like protein
MARFENNSMELIGCTAYHIEKKIAYCEFADVISLDYIVPPG